MGRIIAIANQKGGVGKTTTSINLSACLAEKGFKTLAIDMDPQGHLTTGLGVNKDDLEYTIYDVMCDNCNIGEAMIINVVPDLNLLPSNRYLAGAEVEFVGQPDMQYILKNQLSLIQDKFDFIIIDCPPALGMLTINSMTAANTVLVPIQCEFFALDGLSQLIYTIELIQQKLNKDLKIEGVVFTMYDSRTNLSLQVVENVKENLQQNVYKTIIPRNVRLAEAPSHGMPITLYDTRSAGAENYRLLADEVITNIYV
ncbi:MAG: AAA family ATPase [Eubacteriales bacterium]|nr:AAA family ATPase [Eubacteriales bacterium]